MATHSSILAWRIPMDRGGWQAAVHGVAKCHVTEHVRAHTHTHTHTRAHTRAHTSTGRMTNAVNHLFIHLLTIVICFILSILFKSFAYLSIGCLLCPRVIILGVLYTFWVWDIRWLYELQISFPTGSCLFTLKLSPGELEFEVLVWLTSSNSPFTLHAFCVLVKECRLTQGHEDSSLSYMKVLLFSLSPLHLVLL